MKEFIGCLKKYACFSGRARRREYWMFYLFGTIASIVAFAIDAVLGTFVFSPLVTLGMLLPFWGVLFRRLHDTGRSGWWWMISLVPFVGGIILFVFTCLDSQPGENKYGPNPKGL